MAWMRLLSEADFLKQCRLDISRGSGPGGQKRNKTSNAVRITHLPTKLVATGTETRSLAENKLHALRRLRLKIAIELREPIDLLTFEPPTWFLTIRHEKRLQVSHRHPLYAPTAGLMLDLLDALNGNPTAVAANLGISTSSVIKFLKNEPAVWIAANAIRASVGLKPLSQPA